MACSAYSTLEACRDGGQYFGREATGSDVATS